MMALDSDVISLSLNSAFTVSNGVDYMYIVAATCTYACSYMYIEQSQCMQADFFLVYLVSLSLSLSLSSFPSSYFTGHVHR